ncbi:hypothetical protein [Arthrobacter castelli]|uniref:hypothetical protein n=1 Tax=Arthrobacter castelli TaxID=271431 RepID=UPI0004082707|nr:hypothetical protein [Arthrobacter castelli]
MSEHDDILAAARKATEGTPYVVEPSEDGFTLTLDLVDAQWWTLYQRNGLRKVFTHTVTIDEPEKKYTIGDESRTLSWVAGAAAGEQVPRLSADAETFTGRSIEMGTRKEWGLTDQGVPAKVVDYSFDTAEAHSIIRSVFEPRGYTERLPAAARGALYFAIGVVGAMILAGLVILVVWLL